MKMIKIPKERHLKDLLTKEVGKLIKFDNVNVATFYEHFIYQNYLCLILEICNGMTIKQFILEQSNPLEETSIFHIFLQIINALKYFHDRNIVHRNINSTNLILSQNNVVKLVDFGIEKALCKNNQINPLKIRISSYTSPETILEQKYSFASDI
jgi:serine/threonine protein kinase